MQLHVEIYDQYQSILDNTGTLIHPSSGFTVDRGVVSDLDEAKNLVTSIYEESKQLGNYTDVLVNLNEPYAELLIKFSDGKILNRVIYPINR